MTSEPFFHLDSEGRFVPTDICRGPWDPNTLHGRVLAGLMADEMEKRWGDAAFHPARLTVDLFRMPRFAPVDAVSSHIVRDGNRIRVVDAECSSEGVSLARASLVLLRRTDNPTGTVWSPPPWDVPLPDTLPAPQTGNREPAWETRPLGPGFGSTGQKRAWLRDNRQLIDGVELTPFVRAALMADFTNPFGNSGSQGLEFVNADITLYLHRLPAAEWLGFEVTTHHSHEGIAVAECAIYDEKGAIGRSVVCAVANRRTPRG